MNVRSARGSRNVVGLCLAFSCLSATVVAQGRDRTRPLRSEAEVLEAFSAVVAAANHSVVEIAREDDVLGFATCVGDGGLFVAKASELRGDAGFGGLHAIIEFESDDAYEVQSQPVEFVGEDEPQDLVVLRIETSRRRPVQWSDAGLRSGAWVAAADGRGAPVAVGIVSAAVYTHSPRDPALLKRGYLGVQLGSKPDCASIGRVYPDTAAAAAGLEDGDVVTAVNGIEVADNDAFRRAIRAVGRDNDALFSVLRGEQKLELKATLRPAPEALHRRGQQSSQERVWGALSEVRAGFGEVIQHDTILTPAQCGGPIVDLSGKVVGINIARAGRVESLALPPATIQATVEAVLVRAAEALPTELTTADPAGSDGK